MGSVCAQALHPAKSAPGRVRLVRDWACRPPLPSYLPNTHPHSTLPAVPQELAAAAVQLAKEGREGG